MQLFHTFIVLMVLKYLIIFICILFLFIVTFLQIETIMKNKNNIGEIAQLISKIDDPQLIEGFLGGILTQAELEKISSRWEIVKMLHQGVSQRKIARKLHLSLCNITRGSRELKKRNSPLKKVIDELTTE
jgi:TrpR family trp operon transcriptional repressor